MDVQKTLKARPFLQEAMIHALSIAESNRNMTQLFMTVHLEEGQAQYWLERQVQPTDLVACFQGKLRYGRQYHKEAMIS